MTALHPVETRDLAAEMAEIGAAARAADTVLATTAADRKNAALVSAARAFREGREAILAAMR